ncbi:TetR/AcrR family transcriptional regulator [Streptomyces sp. NPDC048057]|uniref:TetR/AcrR family transcriptional regulator n=1 Tax=Streptomyces sp. NPDC048057 TaxID=3155628 RepID=UPI0033DD84B7
MAHVSAAERRPQLIAAAIELMAREGVAAGSTRAIAAELGVAQATVHYTFGTKADLYRAVLETLTADLVAHVGPAIEGAVDLEGALHSFADAVWADFGDRLELNVLWLELVAFSLRTPELREVVDRYYRDTTDIATAALVEIAERTGRTYARPPQELARFLLAGMDGLCLQRVVGGDDPQWGHIRRSLDQLVVATCALADGAGEVARA